MGPGSNLRVIRQRWFSLQPRDNRIKQDGECAGIVQSGPVMRNVQTPVQADLCRIIFDGHLINGLHL